MPHHGSEARLDRLPPLRWLRFGATATVAAICLAVIPFLALEVRDRLDALERANSDNT